MLILIKKDFLMEPTVKKAILLFLVPIRAPDLKSMAKSFA